MQCSRQIRLIRNVDDQQIIEDMDGITVMSVLGKEGPKYSGFSRSRRLGIVYNIDQTGYTEGVR